MFKKNFVRISTAFLAVILLCSMATPASAHEITIPVNQLNVIYEKSDEVDFSIVNVFNNLANDFESGRNIESMPLYDQTDYPDVPYSSGNVADSGCGITCIAMVATYLLGEEYLPDELAWQYNEVGLGNDVKMENAARGLGIQFVKSFTWADTIEKLEEGKVIIALMGEESLFTSYGHFIVLKGITEDGKILVNDPYGPNYAYYPNEYKNGFEQWQIILGYRGGWVFWVD